MLHNSRWPLAGAVAGALAFTCGCADSAQQPPAQQPPAQQPPAPQLRADSVIVVFTRNEAPAPVARPVAGASDLRSALTSLVSGPTAAEQAQGIESWFSHETASVLKDVHVDSAGRATIDFQDLRHLIPNASSSAGSAMLLQELNGTVFQFPEIRSVEYRIDGSCEVFWEWLQFDCHLVQRQGR